MVARFAAGDVGDGAFRLTFELPLWLDQIAGQYVRMAGPYESFAPSNPSVRPYYISAETRAVMIGSMMSTCRSPMTSMMSMLEELRREGLIR